jgi:hypothetical protein
MRKTTLIALFSTGMLFGLIGSAVAQSVTYLPSPPNSWTYPSDINNNGEAVGYSFSMSDFRSQAVRWMDGELSLLEGYASTFAGSINDMGEIVGSGWDDAQYEVPVIWVNGVPEELPTPGFGGRANDINIQGEIVGFVRTSEGGGIEPALWRDGELTLLNSLSGNGGFASTIDDTGVISGVSYASGGGDNLFLPTQWVEGVARALPVTFGTSYAGSLGVNRTGGGQTSGYVIETRTLDDGQLFTIVVAVGWSGDTFRVLQKLDDNQSSWACDVNEFGVYAGYSRDSIGADVPVLWTKDGLTRLPFASGLTARAVALNETGLVIGNDTTSFSVPVIWDLNAGAELNIPNYRGARDTNVPLTVRVMDGNTPMAGKQVKFEVDGVVVGTADSNRSGYARLWYRVPNTAGTKMGVTASVNGMPKIVRAIEVAKSRSSAGVSGTLNQVTGKIQLNASVNAIEPNRSVPNGRVNFFMNGRKVATATTDAKGVARAEVTMPANMGSGAANIEARFAGDNNNRAAVGRSNVEIER